ncbi:MAG TPA: cyclase family protein [Gemmatimonadaceae bacterium]|nr:cyclase family protein [Gemmatimonadaceae bacterium]
MTRLYDISTTLHGDTPPWPGDTPFSCAWPWLIAKGASVNVSALTSSPHVGTHADAPLHVRDGWPGAQELPLESFFGPALVVDVTGEEEQVSLEALARALGRQLDTTLRQHPRLLLRTGCTIADGEFPDSWPVLTESCAQALLGFGLGLLGTDAPSVDLKESRTLDVHRMIFGGNGAILENLDLRRVPPGEYELIAFPLKLLGTDAAPVRAVLRGI